jgi:hemerythrin
MIEFDPVLLTGVEEIDAQHRELFERAERFLSGLSGASRRDVGILLSYLRLYAVTHFGAEEAWMLEVRYPGYVRHKAAHDGFLKDLLALSQEHERREGPGLEPVRVGAWLARWLEDHVTVTDGELARFLIARAG